MSLGPGGALSALGDAIMSGSASYRQAKLDQQQKKESEAKLKTEALQQQLLQANINDLPRKRAMENVDFLDKQYGDDKYSIPGYLTAMRAVGAPVPTKDVTGARINDIESGAGNPILSNDQQAAKMGVDPTTGAVIPGSVINKRMAEQAALKKLTLSNNLAEQELNGGGSNVLPQPPGTQPNTQPPAQPAGPAGSLTGQSVMPTPPPGVAAPHPSDNPGGIPGDDPGLPNGMKTYIDYLHGKFPGNLLAQIDEYQRAYAENKAKHPGLDNTKAWAYMSRDQLPESGKQPTQQQPPEVPFEDPAARRQRLVGNLTGLDPNKTEHESMAHVREKARVEAEAKAAFRPPVAALQKEADAYAKIRVLQPKVEAALKASLANPNDPHAQSMGALSSIGHWAKAKAVGAAYTAGLPVSDLNEEINQLAGLYKVIGASPYMVNSRSHMMYQEAGKHLPDVGLMPEVNLQRLDQLKTLYPEFEELLHGGGRGQTGPTLNQNPLNTPPPRQASSPMFKPGDQVPFATIKAVATQHNLDVNDFVAALKKEGVIPVP